ncbi:MAG: transaldolase [Pseudomonadota bacterium]
MNPLLQLLEHGQSYWLDNLTRGKIRSGELHRRVTEEGLRGVTSNPTIFNKAISQSQDYDEQIQQLIDEGRSSDEIYEALVIRDIQDACDVLRPVYDESGGLDGYISLEVSPHHAHDTLSSVAEARHLHSAVNRPNLLIKIPGSPEGVPAIEELLFEGINVNVTLLFAIDSYEAVAWAYIRALERRVEMGLPVHNIASVASFFLSRIDVLVDQLLKERMQSGAAPSGMRPEELLGKAAVANAKLAYQRFRAILQGERWQALAARGARVQRMLWASTSTKTPGYSDVMYVEPLIGPDTVNTMPDETIAAFADHGVVRDTVAEGVDEAQQVMEELARLGIDFRQVTDQLLREGVQKFVEPYDALIKSIDDKRRDLHGAGRTASAGMRPGAGK